MIFRHKAKGGLYRIQFLSTQESNLQPLVTYSCIESGHMWTRPADEFFDGRFDVVPPDSDQYHAPEMVQ